MSVAHPIHRIDGPNQFVSAWLLTPTVQFWPVVVFFYCSFLQTDTMSVLGGFPGSSNSWTEPSCVSMVVGVRRLLFRRWCPVLAGGRPFLLFLFTDEYDERLRWLPLFIELLDRTIVRLHAHRCLQQASFLARVVGNSHANTHNHSLSFLEHSLDDSVVSLILSDSVGMTSNDRFILIRTND